MTKVLCNTTVEFMDGTHGAPGETVDVDPSRVTDLADLQATVIDGKPAIEIVSDVAPQKSAQAVKVTLSNSFPATGGVPTAADVNAEPAQEVTNSEQS